MAAGAHYGDPHGGDARVGLAALCFGAVYLVACVVAAQTQKSALLKIAALGWSTSIAMCAGYFVLTWDPPKPNFRLQADGYEGMDWVEDYYKEFLESNQTHWQPYVYWRRPPYAGKQIHVDDEGLRRTWIDTKAPDDAPRIFMLGGSTMWGTGARDDETIPSFLARSLSKEGVPVRVHNYGETGYVSTQCLIRLLLELRRGNVPDVVVTYDGANDMYSGFQTKRAGIPQNEIRRRQDYLRGNGPRPPPTPKLGPDELVEQVAALYRANLRVVASLGKEYGFELCAFWQPSLFFKKPLTEYERGRIKKRSSEMAE
ncbi:MAG: SGNH/GDSL hydrolase family protein, partial [Planctomycetota bacterium]